VQYDCKQMTTTSARGFTLIEMLTVIGIIGILASITMMSLSGARERARDGEKITELGQILLSLELYYDACGRYPNESSDSINTGDSTGCPSGVDMTTFLPGGALPTAPVDSYIYSVYNSNSDFILKVSLEQNNAALVDDVDGTVDGIACADTSPDFNYCKGS
jgi:prepilin-type N-terminal cleavage/methylation domain-containing protein